MGNLLESCEHREPAPLAIGMLATERNLRNRLHRRLIKLHGTCNFRDVGGHKTGRGRSVRWGEVYRADRLSTLAWEAQATSRIALHSVQSVKLIACRRT